MNVVYAQEQIPAKHVPSIFLAGPTPRAETGGESWRPEALRILEAAGFEGTVFVPEPRDGTWGEYIDQFEWEWTGLNLASIIVFWVPREMSKMPALTTNIEWGIWASSGKCILGTPKEAVHVAYMHVMASKLKVPLFKDSTLADVLWFALGAASTKS